MKNTDPFTSSVNYLIIRALMRTYYSIIYFIGLSIFKILRDRRYYIVTDLTVLKIWTLLLNG
jgi:hypothetical protein